MFQNIEILINTAVEPQNVHRNRFNSFHLSTLYAGHPHNSANNGPRETATTVPLLNCIRKVSGSNLYKDTYHPEVYSGFLESLHVSAGLVS
jgi:hypothetical protein